MIQIFLAGKQSGQPEVVQEVLADLKTCFCSARISRDIDWPCNCASQKATDNTWGVRSENHTSVFPVLQVRIMSTCTQWHIGWAWSRVGEGQTPPSDDEACLRSNRDQDTFGKNIDGNIWSCGKKSSRTLRHSLEHEIYYRLTYPRDVSNFCKNAEDSENMRIKHVLRFSRDLWSTVKMKESQPEGLVHQEGQVFFQRYGRNLL